MNKWEQAATDAYKDHSAPVGFYNPDHEANGYMDGERFIADDVPEGYELDVDAWKSAGEIGGAPLKLKAVSPAPVWVTTQPIVPEPEPLASPEVFEAASNL